MVIFPASGRLFSSPMTRLTDKQQVVLQFIQAYLEQNQRAPVIREIQAGCQITSYKSTLDRLNALERKGYIRRTPNKHRGIEILEREETLIHVTD